MLDMVYVSVTMFVAAVVLLVLKAPVGTLVVVLAWVVMQHISRKKSAQKDTPSLQDWERVMNRCKSSEEMQIILKDFRKYYPISWDTLAFQLGARLDRTHREWVTDQVTNYKLGHWK